ncbi:MAG TPA: hypothetical protein VN281_20600 [Verrucomicrobiae bacterium]|nr:hypothetical protein [Verrucomicrobiae bacterium]
MIRLANMRMFEFKICLGSLSFVVSALAQTVPVFPTTNSVATSNLRPANIQSGAKEAVAAAQHVEEMRAACIKERRMICGKILKVLPDGLVIDSGYSSLMGVPPNGSWLLPGTTVATHDVHVVESNEPDAVCQGIVFLTDLPKGQKGAKPKAFDYVKLEGFPIGQYTYTSVGDVRRTVRKFTCNLPNAVKWKLDEEGKPAATK